MKIKKDDIIMEVLKNIAPGTNIREGLDNILKAKTGGLVVIGDGKEIMDIVDGGFKLDVEYTPARLYELAKMDGAIVLNKEMKRILLANTQLIPLADVPTSETGTRHRTAERTARQTGELVISISQRRNIITIYKGDSRYVLEDTSKVITNANQALQTVEKYKKVFDDKLKILNEYEFNDIVTLQNVITVIQRAEMVMRMVEEVRKCIYELGEEGVLIEMQLEELVGDLEKEELLIIKDYSINKEKQDNEILEEIKQMPYEDISKNGLIAKLLGYDSSEKIEELTVYTRGYRLISKIPRMPNNIVDNLINSFESFQTILDADIETLDEVEGIGEVRAKSIKKSLRRMEEQFLFEKF